MDLTPPEREQTNKYILDIKNTLISNILNIILAPVAVIYITIFNDMITSFASPEMQIIGLFVFAYSTVKIISALCNVNLEYTQRIGKKEE